MPAEKDAADVASKKTFLEVNSLAQIKTATQGILMTRGLLSAISVGEVIGMLEVWSTTKIHTRQENIIVLCAIIPTATS